MRGAFLLLGICLVAASAPAAADEQILSWDSRIVVEKTGDLLVTETILVWAEGKNIKEGIFRDIAWLREGRKGKHSSEVSSAKRGGKRRTIEPKNPIEVLSVKRGGKNEPYRTEGLGPEEIRIRIGREGTFLKPGPHLYELTYRAERLLYFQEGQDGLYWNVHGQWEFSADKVSATVVLPEGIRATKVWGYTGKDRDWGEDYAAELTETGATIKATRSFQARENLIFVLEWPPGLLDVRAYERGGREAPFRGSWISHWLTTIENWRLLILLLGATFLSYFVVWLFLGRDPRKGAVVTRYFPPEGLSAGAAAYCARMDRLGYDDTCFSAGILGLAAKGAIHIERTAGDSPISGAWSYALHAKKIWQGSGKETADLSPDETSLYENLLGEAADLKLTTKNRKHILKARTAHQSALETQQKALNFRMNRGWSLPGILLSVGVTLIILFEINPWPGAIVALFGSLGLIPCWTIPRKKVPPYCLFLMLTTALIMLPCVLAGGEHAGSWPERVDMALALAFSALVYAGNLGALYLLKAPTRTGRQMLDQLEGFRLFLANEIRETDPNLRLRYRQAQDPQVAPSRRPFELFERFLPFAVALDCGEQWASQFGTPLREAEADPEDCRLDYIMGDFGAGFTAVLAAAGNDPGNASNSTKIGDFLP